MQHIDHTTVFYRPGGPDFLVVTVRSPIPTRLPRDMRIAICFCGRQVHGQCDRCGYRAGRLVRLHDRPPAPLTEDEILAQQLSESLGVDMLHHSTA